MFLNSLEWQALDDLVIDGYLLAYVMYVSSFRRRMDFDTAVVGRSKPSSVSYAYLQSLLERRSKPGSHWKTQCPSLNEIRGEISALEKAGLLTRLPKLNKTDPMLFLLPLADRGAVRVEEEQHRKHKGGGTKEKPATTLAGEGVNPVGTTNEQPHITETQNIQQKDFSVPVIRIIDLYHQVLPRCKQIRAFYDPALTEKIIAVWTADVRHTVLPFWQFLFEQVRDSDFLRGRDFDQRRGKFEVNLYFILDNVPKILNGRYS
tara:strand:+ start:1705 stop:2487 length:783 start_codon:yes stop_codon:yes gene_type:complete